MSEKVGENMTRDEAKTRTIPEEKAAQLLAELNT